MTASNLIVGDQAAYLVTDAAFYDGDDILREIRSKIAHSVGFKMALTVGGMAYAYQLTDELDANEGHDQAYALRTIAKNARARREDNRVGNPAGEAVGHNELHVYVVMWSEAFGRPEGWALSSSAGWFGDKYESFAWVPVDQIQTPPPATPVDRWRFRAHRDGRRMLEDQRRQMVPGQHVGGFGQLATVTRTGVTVDRLQTWPDVVGERIKT